MGEPHPPAESRLPSSTGFSDDGNTLYNWAWLALEMAFAGLVLAYALGFVA